ncbi:MAG: NucA/NucB deoxyribonuclease domain-containing protein [Nostocoides sp.]
MHVVGVHECITAGQRWGNAPPQADATAGFCVAAKSEAPTVVFSRSRAPGIAGTFDDAVANGAPTQLSRVGTAARDANRRAALRGQSPAPAGQSLDKYPFACSAQGGCGATVRSVPVGEQSYQGGVLSRFFQDNGIGVGDPFNVTCGP